VCQGWNVANCLRLNPSGRHSFAGQWFRTLLHRSIGAATLCLILLSFNAVTLSSQTLAATPKPRTPAGRECYLKGMELVRQGKVADAISVFAGGLAYDPQDPVLLDATGAAYMVEGESEQAQRYFLSSLRANPTFVAARKNLAISYFTSGRYEPAAAEFQKLTKVPGPTQQIASLFLGIINEKSGNYARALVFFGQSGALVNRYADALLCLADSEYQLKHTQKAHASLRSLAAIPDLTAEQHLKASQLYSQLGEDDAALAEAQKAGEMDGSLSGLALQRAVTLDRVGRTKESFEILRAEAQSNPTADTLNLLSHVARENNEFALALDSLRQAAKLAPEKEENYLDFSTFCADYGNYPLALEAADVGLQNIPGSYRLLVQRAVILENLGRADEAEATLRKASEQQKDNSVALLSLAIVETHDGHLHEAEATLRSAIHDFPSNYYMHYQLGVALVEMQSNLPPAAELQARARQAFREAIRLNPSFADSYYQLAKLYTGNSPKLEEQNLVACLRADPNHAPAQYKLARVYLSTGRTAEAQVLIDRFEALKQAAKDSEMQRPRIEPAAR
jgi:tetratricopeptide (TPR) repeat protein